MFLFLVPSSSFPRPLSLSLSLSPSLYLSLNLCLSLPQCLSVYMSLSLFKPLVLLSLCLSLSVVYPHPHVRLLSMTVDVLVRAYPVHSTYSFCPCLAMGLQDYSEIDEATAAELSSSKAEKRKASILAPWDLPAAKLLRNGKKSPIESIKTYEELWDHMKEATKGQLYKSEFASSDPIVRGVAISRTAQGVASVCQSILEGEDAE